MHHIAPTFRTLEAAGYTACAHPRQMLTKLTVGDRLRCMDCGAFAPSFHDGTLDYPRKPILVP